MSVSLDIDDKKPLARIFLLVWVSDCIQNSTMSQVVNNILKRYAALTLTVRLEPRSAGLQTIPVERVVRNSSQTST